MPMLTFLKFKPFDKDLFDYTPGIYADGYIVFAFPFVRSFVRSLVRFFVRNSGTFVEFMSKFWLKFLKRCISHEPMVRNYSYLDHRYPIGFALFLLVWTLGPCPGVGLEVKI